ncbi:VWA domain-containing protein [Sedimentitalea sp. JM2-8]|uniref:VWA domain-containing protein n=1 Tax=Sedimentitalea xiamensis TaxID=3050037 RepID=A0ABT7FFJ3_9RHOB|nr:VWA domain-containing protein [Sedimentitalea xiamensis]MDK3073760.1 VWA domain-containing protein [Sedimentitalea xiamensis]
MIDTLAAFHFLRPAWLLALLGVAAVWYLTRPRGSGAATEPGQFAPHLFAALQIGSGQGRRVHPGDGVAAGLVLLTLAAAGPTWSRVPNPLIAETAPLVVALKVTESMETPDLAPTRLDRARFKVLDLIAARAGARTALVAYAGTAHRVSPLTEDPNILRPLLEGLSPQVMPKAGQNATAAFAMARDILDDADSDGAVLFVLDDLDPVDIAAFDVDDGPPVVFLLVLPEGRKVAQLDGIDGATIVQISPDDSDINLIERRLRSAHRAALLADDRLAWDDRGWWLVWPAALLALLSFRKGWTIRWGIAIILALAVQTPGAARADGWLDWFLTPDQQGRLAYENKDFAKAADLFQDPMWRGHAMMKAGRYADAAALFARLDSAEAAFAEGTARIRNREYRPGARAFETALVRRPGWAEAETNRDVAWAIVAFVEETAEASDTGEDTGIGADELVFDNESNRGAETQIEAPKEDSAPLTAEQWIDSIDTDMGDFLRSRFLLDTSGDAE